MRLSRIREQWKSYMRKIEVSGYGEPATGRQLHTIALLCVANSIRESLEDRHMTIGEAGLLIRRLEDERRYRQVTVRTRHPASKKKDL